MSLPHPARQGTGRPLVGGEHLHRHTPTPSTVLRVLTALLLFGPPLFATSAPAAADTLAGRWTLLAAEDLRADGTVARQPWGPRPAGTIVVEGGWCYLQIMSTDVPAFASGAAPVGDQMKAALLSNYIAYTGPCVVDDAGGRVTLKVEAAWRPDYVGTQQVRYFRFEGGRLLFGPAPGSMQVGGERLTRRLTLERAPPAPPH